MRYVISIVAAVVLVLGVVLVIRGESDDESGSPAAAARTETRRRTAGAYECMPPATRRRFDRAVKRFDARFGYVLDHAAPQDADRPVDEVLEADARYVALRSRARAILVDYLPGGGDFDAECYRRAVARYDRIAQPD